MNKYLKIPLISSFFLILLACNDSDVLSTGVSEMNDFDKKYVVIANPDPQYNYKDKISVIEVFWYGCPHCYQMEYHLDTWLKEKPADVAFIRVPGVTNDLWQPLARTYFAADMLGVVDQIHIPLFHAIHRDGRSFTTDAEIQAFVEERGVDGDAFMKVFYSTDVQLVLEDIYNFAVNYRIASVPALIINNKYVTAPSMVGSYEQTLPLVDYLIDKERQAMAEK
jgi:thiol:disulfide interchange protein DsbA